MKQLLAVVAIVMGLAATGCGGDGVSTRHSYQERLAFKAKLVHVMSRELADERPTRTKAADAARRVERRFVKTLKQYGPLSEKTRRAAASVKHAEHRKDRTAREEASTRRALISAQKQCVSITKTPSQKEACK